MRDERGVPGGVDEPVDLRALRLSADRYGSLAVRIEAATAPALARRSLGGGVQRVLAQVMWPTLIAAAAAMVAAVGLGGTSSSAAAGLAATGIEHVLPGRTTDLAWIEEQRAPTDADLVQALGLGGAR